MPNSISVNTQKVVNCVSETLIESSIAGGIGYCCARCFRGINPLHALALSAMSMAVSKLTKSLFDRVFNNEHSNEASKLVGPALNLTACAIIYSGVVNLLAVYAVSITSIAISAFLGLNAVSVAAYVAVNVGETVIPTLLAEIN
jgi:hypothetical protein